MLHDAECNTFLVEVDQLFSPLQGFSSRSAAASAWVTTVHDDALVVVVVVQSLLFIVLPLWHTLLCGFLFFPLFFLNDTVMWSRTRRRSLLVCAPRSPTSVLSSFTNISHAILLFKKEPQKKLINYTVRKWGILQLAVLRILKATKYM